MTYSKAKFKNKVMKHLVADHSEQEKHQTCIYLYGPSHRICLNIVHFNYGYT